MRIELEKKIYHIYSEYAEEILLHISNHDEQGLKKVSRLWSGETDISLNGNGAVLVYHRDIIPFYIQNCENVVLENFTIQYDEQIYAQGIVRETSPKYMEIEIDREHDPWRIRNGRCLFLCDGKWLELREWLEWDVDKKAPVEGIRDVYLENENQDGISVAFTEVAENLLGVTIQGEACFPEKSRVGNVLVMRHHMRTHPAIYVCDSKNVTVKNVTITDSRGMGILAERTEDILLDHVDVKLPEDGSRVYSITADATHFVYCKGKIEIHDCLFENQMDDAVNIHGIYLRIHEILEGSSVIAEWVHPMQKGVPFGNVGDVIGVVDNETMLTIDLAEIREIEVYNRDFAKITLEHLPENIKAGFVLENQEYVPDVLITDCEIRNNRARGILVTSNGKVMIRKNNFQTAGTAILVEGDANYWFESGATKEIVVEENTFERCDTVKVWGEAVIQVSPGVTKTDGVQRYHQSLVIRNNEFQCIDHSILKTNGIAKVYFHDNHVETESDNIIECIIDFWTKQYEADKELSFVPIIEELKAAAEEAQESEYVVYLRFLKSLVPYLYQHYEKMHFPQHIAVDTMDDLKWKMRECQKVYGVDGIFVPDWFEGFFQMKRFTLGRLQFELWPTPEDYPFPKEIRREEVLYVINVHIPGSGSLKHEDCTESYQKAREFFGKYFGIRRPFFYCDSWLLTPAHEKILPEQSNIRSFMEDYKIYEWVEDQNGHDLWRIFGRSVCSNLAELPETTSLQKVYKKWLLDGNYSGCGKGALIERS